MVGIRYSDCVRGRSGDREWTDGQAATPLCRCYLVESFNKVSDELNRALWTNCQNNHFGVERSSSAAREPWRKAADGRDLQLFPYLVC